jgi:hypothetical protein
MKRFLTTNIATLLVAVLVTPGRAADLGPLKSLSVETGRGVQGFVLAGRESWQQVLVTGHHANGERDMTREVEFTATPEGVVWIDTTGLVTPRKEGKAVIEAEGPDGFSARTEVTVSNLVEDVPVNFSNQIVPIFTKFGCNAGGCHGKASGQNGFKLSLLGFEPGEDYEYVVKEARGRRILPSAPAHSLLITKATGQMAHGGGKKLEKDSPYAHLILRWIEQGTPYGRPNDPVVKRIEVLPRERVMEKHAEQQLTVIAHMSDGTTVDVTRMTQFETNVAEMAEVSETGLVAVHDTPGSVAVMTRFQSHVDVFQALVPMGAPVAELPPAKTFIDELVYKQLTRLGLPPSALCDDGTFIRRATVDIAGRLPTSEEVDSFIKDQSADKYEKLVDRLLDSDEYAGYFANKWSAILRNRRKTDKDDPKPTFAFHAWIREAVKENMPYDQFVRDLLTATGKEVESPPVVWYREVQEPTAQVEDVAQLFLGQRIGCARCHHHPFEKWSQQDYYGMVAFFSQLEIKDPPAPKPAKGSKTPPPKPPFEVHHKKGVANAVNLKNDEPVKPTGLLAEPLDIPEDVDPRAKLVDWMVQKDNPFFARSLANRYWKHFLGRGLVEPEDDIRVTNPPTNPELLDALAQYFTESKYDTKKLIRAICTSNVYRLSAVPNEHNADDRQSFSRYLPRRLNAEVLLDAIDAVTLAKSNFKGVPEGTRAVDLPDNQFESYFLSVFGRPDAASACECERSGDANLAQSLHMLNSTEILAKTGGARAQQLARDKRPHEERLRELYLVALSREPSAEEMKVLLAHIEKKGEKSTQVAYEDAIWAVVNMKEFLFNH